MQCPQDPRVARTIAAMEEDLARRWRVQDLAAICGLSASRFAHLFRDATGMSPLRRLHELRLERARELLKRTSLSVQDVMALVGATDASHFSRDFRNHFGMTPREYRREHSSFNPVRCQSR